MQKTFTLQNMETYFSNYVSCNQHKKEPITNFCTEAPCLKFLCPECIQLHSSVHSNHSIESIKTCIKRTSQRLRQTIIQLQAQTGRNSFLKADNSQQYTKQLIKQLQEVKEGLIQEIKAYFKQKEYDIRKQTSKFVQIQKKLQSLRRDLVQATTELKMLDKNLFSSAQTLNAIRKANKISYRSMVDHFHQRIDEVESQMSYNVKLEMNTQKRESLRTSLNELIGISNRTGTKVKQGTSYIPNKSKHNEKPHKQSRHKQKNLKASRNIPTNSYQVNAPLSADRLLQQNSFRIEKENYFKSEPFLHFFELTNSTLHLIRLNEIKQNEPIKWNVINLNIEFPIPSFHRTLATEIGNIYIIGGTIAQNQNLKKSKTIYQYDPIGKALLPVANLVIPRSSHSIVCHRELIYIVGGMTENDQALKKCELFNPKTLEVTLLASCKYPTTNSCFCSIGDSQLIKLGGVFANGQNNDTIQIYNIKANVWGQIDPTIQNVNSQFGLLSCSGWAPLNQNQIFIFGGYNEEAESQNSRMSFVLEQNKDDKQFYIKYVNQKNPPLAEGFWNQQGIVHNGLIYCLQNVDGEQGNDCLEDKRNLLIFNGKTWSICVETTD